MSASTFGLLGGAALLISGIRLVGAGLQRAAGARLRHLLSTLTGNRVTGLAVGAVVTALLQSSSATTVMLVGFASAGLLSLRQTIGVILGADVGTTVTVQLLAFNILNYSLLIVFAGWLLFSLAHGNLRYIGQAIFGLGLLFLAMKLLQDGMAHAGFKVMGVLLFIFFIPQFADLVARTSPDVPRQIANAHTIFNVMLALLFLPFAGLAADVVTRLVPERTEPRIGAIYLDAQILDTPALALGQATREVLRMADLVVASPKQTIEVFRRDDEELLREIVRRDDHIDRLEEDIKQYLTRLRVQTLNDEQARREIQLLFVITDLEAIGDVIDKNLMELA